MKVLVVEDDPNSLTVRAALLKAHGCEVLLAKDGTEGLGVFMREHVDVTVLDLGLPDIDGEQVLRRIREIQPDARVVVLTGRIDVPMYVQNQATAVLVKGSGAQALLDALAPQAKGGELLRSFHNLAKEVASRGIHF